MSYQVLARKWRPRRFVEMVGQEHVLKALVNALDEDRLHHAYLFTGTRGVGKTSIARLFAKSLNCEEGVSSEPCGKCSSCIEIAEGRFVDLIEVDAASRTKVEDTRELLENVQYAPTQGRYKVYLIDEVHMLSGHSFNALLKTLEEPPPHIKFLLATTDPQKLPITILSRCLQFNLKNLPAERIVEHLNFVLGEESIQFDDAALWLLARSAEGSMRDALSLTDQAIAFGAGSVNETDVRAMLGTIDHRLVFELLESLIARNGKQMMADVQRMAEFTPDYAGVLAEMISILHRIALAQVVPDAVDNSLGDEAQIKSLAAKMRGEEVQLYYQIALNGRKDLPMVPQPREGLEMTLLRMLAFRPVDQVPIDTQTEAIQSVSPNTPEPASMPARKPEVSEVVSKPVVQPAESSNDVPPWEDVPPAYDEEYAERFAEDSSLKKSEAGSIESPDEDQGSAVKAEEVAEREIAPLEASEVVVEESLDLVVQPAIVPAMAPESNQSDQPLASDRALPTELMSLRLDDWFTLVDQLGLSGMTESLARSLSLEQVKGNRLVFHFTSEQETLLNDTHRKRIDDALAGYFNEPMSVEFCLGDQHKETPAAYRIRRAKERKAAALAQLQQDPIVLQLIETFGAVIDEASVEALDKD